MRIEIYEEEVLEKEVVLRLRLMPIIAGTPGVRLVAVDANGEKLPQGNLLFIQENGFSRPASVNKNIPLPMDRTRVRIVTDF